ncbi:DUF5131 family protein [Nitrospirillum amazonense]|uniref:DUF5131 family protein n=1 Tax=Nitrospirillum amazonense TaxID=28077 RepID=UPI002DD4509B|nr:DUF5131 family protein [Nitrospirillum amazonense]MEC4591633.1 DUF5131 family protein [Nitrospirillum amazonense]
MSTVSQIEWTDRTWTPVVGCDAISPACANCFAATMAARLVAMGTPKYEGTATRHGAKGKWTGRVNVDEREMLAPPRVKKPQRWFLTSMGDVGHAAVTDETLDRLFAVMALCPHHTFYVLTKRPERLAEYLLNGSARDERGNPAEDIRAAMTAMAAPAGKYAARITWPMTNVIIGCTAEDQQRADERRGAMRALALEGWRTMVSYEPALGLVDWSGWEFLSWLISGGESGHGARPSHPDWHRAARDWCAANGVPYLFKQWGEYGTASVRMSTGEAVFRQFDTFQQWVNKASTWVHPGAACVDRHGRRLLVGKDFMRARDEDAFPVTIMDKMGKKAAGRTLDGRTHDEVPA